MPDKISYEELLRQMHDPSIPEAELRPYLMAAPESGPFDPVVVPDPDRVAITEVQMDAASAIRIGNGLARWRRQRRFQMRRDEALPVLVSEGDSWFQFPFLITDVIDHLGSDYLVWSLDAAGDTARNMVERNPEYLDALRRFKGEVRAFLFSAAGNDVIGKDAAGNSSLLGILRPHLPGSTAEDLIEGDVLDHILAELTGAYSMLVGNIRAVPELARLPIIIHGYDYPFAYPHAEGGTADPRNPRHAARDEWLGSAFAQRGIMNPDIRRAVLELLIDKLYGALAALAGNSEQTAIYLVDCRNGLPAVADWADEIHPTDEGFGRIAARFRTTLAEALAEQPT